MPGIVPTPGPLTQSQRVFIEETVLSTPADQLPAKVDAIAAIVQKNPSTVIAAITTAREKLQQHAEKYVDVHAEVAARALARGAKGDYAEARKAAEWALEHISATDGEGKTERVIERATAASTAPQIRIGISLGGMPNTTRELPPQTIDAKVITRDDA
jgi:hypothetical protein